MRGELGLHRLKQRGIKNGLVLTAMNVATVDHLADIEAVLKQMRERADAEPPPADGPAGRQPAGLAANSAPVEVLRQRAHRAKLEIAGKDRANRFGLAAEAGFFPGIILYLSYWFPAHRRAAITSLFMAAVPISVVLGSPLSSALLELHGIGGLKGWQWMFLLEAVPAVILGFVVLFYMTDRPEKAKWLPDDQRAWLVDAMEAERARKAGHASHSIWRGLANRRVLALSLVYFGTSAGLYTLSIWAPQIIKEFGLTTMQVGFINAIPPTVAVIAMYLWAWHSDRKQERTWHVVIACLAAAAGLALAGIANTVVSVVAALTLVNIGISSAKPPLWIMPTMFLSGPAAATGIATINSIGNLGGFAGPAMIGWIKDLTGSFVGGLYFVGGLLVFSAVLTLVLSRSLQRPATSVAAAHT